MKVIELLNKIANGEEVPKKIKYKGDYWYLKQKYANRLPYYSNGYDKDNLFTGDEEEYFSESLNDEIEIIEEDNKIEKLERFIPQRESDTYCTKYNEVADKINEIIEVLNERDIQRH